SKYYINRSDDGGLTYGPAVVANVGGSTTGNIDVDQRDGTVYFCIQGASPNNNQVTVAVGQPVSLAVTPVLFNTYVAATGQKAISSSPTIMQSVASDHFIHGSNISLAGFTTGTSPNRNLADFFQVAVDPQGMAMIAWADDSADTAAHTYVAHQISGFNLNSGRSLKIKGANTPTRSEE